MVFFAQWNAAGLGAARRGVAWLGEARRQGKAWFFRTAARPGLAGPGLAWRGGKARFFRTAAGMAWLFQRAFRDLIQDLERGT